MQHRRSASQTISDLCEIGRGVESRFQLHDAWLTALEPLGFDRALVFDDTRIPGPLTTFASRNQLVTPFEDARKDSIRYLADYPHLRARAAADRDVYEITPQDDWLQVYQEHGVTHGQRQVLALSLHARGQAMSIITLSRDTSNSQPFTRAQKELARLLIPALSLADMLWESTLRAEPAAFDELSKREREICRLVKRGLRNAEIGSLLGSSRNTVRNQLSSAFRKLGVTTRAELAGLE